MFAAKIRVLNKEALRVVHLRKEAKFFNFLFIFFGEKFVICHHFLLRLNFILRLCFIDMWFARSNLVKKNFQKDSVSMIIQKYMTDLQASVPIVSTLSGSFFSFSKSSFSLIFQSDSCFSRSAVLAPEASAFFKRAWVSFLASLIRSISG